MIQGFWKNLIKNKLEKGEKIIALAPMADVTDIVFRRLIAKYSRMGKKGGGPDVMWTEFVSADGLSSAGREVLKRDLEFEDAQRPIVAQLFTSTPENMYKAAKLCKELGFDGIDINMGCPDRSIEKQGAGAKLMTTPEIAKEVIRAAQKGADGLPVTVKTRIGWNKVEYKEWLPHLLEMGLPAITIHLRTRKELSLVPAHWELMKDIVKLVREKTGEVKDGGTIVIGNGDIKTVEEAEKIARETHCDGVMIGKGMFGTPWVYDKEVFTKGKTLEEKLKICLEHTKDFEKSLGDIKNFAIMKKHFKAYINGFDGAKELRTKLMETSNYSEVKKIIDDFIKRNRT